ncbi:helix-turn-helix domain-containing protein [Paenibacillus wynnii]|uniref:helix-turn-helix domain-containing protein n=1 Tax=Paenibacillus wynnii TaxID=268407 RepID=UPI001969E754
MVYDELTQRELDLARLLIEGYNSKQISEKLFLTQGTVKNYQHKNCDTPFVISPTISGDIPLSDPDG